MYEDLDKINSKKSGDSVYNILSSGVEFYITECELLKGSNYNSEKIPKIFYTSRVISINKNKDRKSKKYKLKIPNIKKYSNDRENILKKINEDRSIAKKLILAILNGGFSEKYHDDKNINKFLKDIENESRMLQIFL